MRLDYQTQEISDDQLWLGDRILVQKGQAGRKEVVPVYQVIDGQRQPNPEVTEHVLEAAQAEIYRVGTKPIEGTETVEITETIASETETREDATLWAGDMRVEQSGQAGERKVLTTYKTLRGNEQQRW